MGVPSLFAWLIKKYPNIIFKNNNLKCDALFLDWNCGIHPSCKRVLDKYKGTRISKNKLEEEMIDEVINYLQFIIKISNPTKLLYIAIDGVAPRAKMNQQRSRRFKSVKEKEIISNIKKKYKEIKDCSWDTNAITPGTEFMFKMSSKIKEEIETNDLFHNFKTILSDATIPMEGEHKILNYIKNNNELELESFVIYGLDADLIFLALGAHKKDIFLLREDLHFKNVISIQSDTDSVKQPFCYLYIDCLKDKLIEEIKIGIESNITINETNIINDFIAMCYLLGNDFLPRIPSLHINYSGIDILIKHYNNCINQNRGYLIENNNINFNFLYNMLFPLKKVEGEYFSMYYKKNRNWKPHNNFETEAEKEIYYYENLWPREPDLVKMGLKGWKDRYYNHYFNFNRITENEKLKLFFDRYLLEAFQNI